MRSKSADSEGQNVLASPASKDAYPLLKISRCLCRCSIINTFFDALNLQLAGNLLNRGIYLKISDFYVKTQVRNISDDRRFIFERFHLAR